MTATGHALVGTAIAAKFADPILAIPIALASHVVVDSLPHWDLFTHRRQKSRKFLFFASAVDVLIGFALSFALVKLFFPATSLIYVFIIIIAAQFFDWLTAPYLIFNIKFAPFIWTYKFQKLFDHKLDKPWGIIDQVAFVGIVLLLAHAV